MRLNTEFLITEGLKGHHLLFPNELICQAFGRNFSALQKTLEGRREEINETVSRLLSVGSLEEGRSYVSSLHPDVQHILILLYFQLVDGVLMRRRHTVH
jgi:hypothetical protein